ncbi:MAG: bifunctional phosphoribosyl-AMP cyclohydrolase/phosphoribosyl-ATP diphosphatase HisIE [Acidobacteria bacterium]|nr:bifunctional phosphoribosyl-AMP cyclohydrolase/phosphoribosyl-ATP diphosphatase HisIE [Acidobacteriota bacterium]
MNLDFQKYADGLIPAIVQDAASGRVLMLGFMNSEALAATQASGRVTFYSRSKQGLWTKGETSGNYLELLSITPDCDNDTLLVQAKPHGPTCHTGMVTCFGDEVGDGATEIAFLTELEAVIADRRAKPSEGSYVASLFEEGINRIAQKVGEEAVETVIAAKDTDIEAFKREAADLLFHLMILLNEKGVTLGEIADTLAERHKK